MNKNVEYSPVPIYNRKLARTVLKHKIEKRDGAGANKKIKEYFDKYRQLISTKEE